jgi:hypothetical protein
VKGRAMVGQGDFFQELIRRVTALEQQLASLREWLKRDGKRGSDEPEALERLARKPPDDFAPRAGSTEDHVSGPDSSRFRRRRSSPDR